MLWLSLTKGICDFLFQYYQYLDFIQSNVYFVFSVYLAQFTQVILLLPDASHAQYLVREIEYGNFPCYNKWQSQVF